MKTRRRSLECDGLETRTMLSASPGHVWASRHARPMMLAAEHSMTHHVSTEPTNAVTGGGLVNVPPAPADSDVVALQNVASTNNLVSFLSQFEALSGTDAETRQLALSVLNDARNVDMAVNGFAGGIAVTLPGNVIGPDQAVAQQMIAAAKTSDVDGAYSSLIVQAETSLVGQLQNLATNAQEASIRAFASGLLPTVQADLAAVQGTGMLAPVGTTPSSATLDASDLTTLSTYYAINVMERFLGQITMLVTTRSPIALYSGKLIGDHEQGALVLGGYAASTGTYLPASIPSAAAPMAESVVAGLRTVRPRASGRYDRNYLRNMVMGHSDALKLTGQVIDTTQNPTLKQFALNVQPTIYMHLISAKTLVRAFG